MHVSTFWFYTLVDDTHTPHFIKILQIGRLRQNLIKLSFVCLCFLFTCCCCYCRRCQPYCSRTLQIPREGAWSFDYRQIPVCWVLKRRRSDRWARARHRGYTDESRPRWPHTLTMAHWREPRRNRAAGWGWCRRCRWSQSWWQSSYAGTHWQTPLRSPLFLLIFLLGSPWTCARPQKKGTLSTARGNWAHRADELGITHNQVAPSLSGSGWRPNMNFFCPL